MMLHLLNKRRDGKRGADGGKWQIALGSSPESCIEVSPPPAAEKWSSSLISRAQREMEKGRKERVKFAWTVLGMLSLECFMVFLTSLALHAVPAAVQLANCAERFSFSPHAGLARVCARHFFFKILCVKFLSRPLATGMSHYHR